MKKKKTRNKKQILIYLLHRLAKESQMEVEQEMDEDTDESIDKLIDDSDSFNKGKYYSVSKDQIPSLPTSFDFHIPQKMKFILI